MLKPGSYEVAIFENQSGRSPFLEWLVELDHKTRQRILTRIDRLSSGQFGDVKSVGASLYELRMFFGPGYRVYFGSREGNLVIILTGGDKASQSRDIQKAKEYWKIYLIDHP